MTSIVISIVIFRDIAIPKSIVRSTLPVSSKTGIEKYRPSLEVLCGNINCDDVTKDSAPDEIINC